MNVDLAIVARDLKLPPEKIQTTVELLDAGNTIPFITRFRKDATGGLNEKQIQAIKQRVAQLRALTERKEFVLKSIESQGKISEELKTQIEKATTSRRLEDLYLPFKAKKQTRAQMARQQGLEPLANEILDPATNEIDLAERATHFVRVDKGLTSVDEVISGVGDLVAERFSENDELRSSLRKIIWTEGKLVSKVIVTESSEEEAKPAETQATETSEVSNQDRGKGSGDAQPNEVVSEVAQPDSDATTTDSKPTPESPTPGSSDPTASDQTESDSSSETNSDLADEKDSAASEPTTTQSAMPQATSESAGTETAKATAGSAEVSESTDQSPSQTAEPAQTEPAKADGDPASQPANESPAAAKPKKKKKKKKKRAANDPFKDFHDFSQSIKQLPHYRVLAINRGERSNKLKVNVEVDWEKLTTLARQALVPENHPSSEFLNRCADDALGRLILPSLEREVRRELTEVAENHAVDVFANNLKNLLLQPPIRNKVVLAIDPGFKRGCSVAVINQNGDLLDSGHIFVVGNQTRQDDGKKKLADWVTKHSVNVIAIGNGAACRQTEQIVSDLIASQFKEQKLQYVMVNEAGASFYSTSEIGREEFPDLAPSIRSALSIGRRLQDPLSELVKISPANIGVGMYQHDVKAKHLSESLDDVVQFCVNQVGVDVNTASPSLLRHVSGMNALTARRLVELRKEKGKFNNREELKEVSGFGDATFVQSAGFLRVHDGDTPLDRTGIHPESYSIAEAVVKEVDAKISELILQRFTSEPTTPVVDAPTQTAASSDVAPTTTVEVAEEPAAEAPVESVAAETQAVVTEQESGTPPAESDSQPESNSVEANASEEKASGESENQSAEETGEQVAANPVPPEPAEPKKIKLSAEEKAERDAKFEKRKQIVKSLSSLDQKVLAEKLGIGQLSMRDIVLALKRPNWDPRDKITRPIFRSGIIKLDDLKPEMQVDGQVVNVVDFGVFMDIGLGESSLIHVSQLSNQFIRDPHKHFTIGDVLTVWVTDVDLERRRVKLTAIRPGSKKPPRGRSGSRGKPQQGSRSRSDGKGRAPRGSKGKPRFDKKSHQKRSHGYRGKPKPVKPITEGMLKGDEPMRSFSDLAQFVTKKSDDSKDDKKKKSKGDS